MFEVLEILYNFHFNLINTTLKYLIHLMANLYLKKIHLYILIFIIQYLLLLKKTYIIQVNSSIYLPFIKSINYQFSTYIKNIINLFQYNIEIIKIKLTLLIIIKN